jgi:hypothetical protein
MARKNISVAEDIAKDIASYAKSKNLELGEAADSLIATGVKRIKALSKYNRAHTTATPKAGKAKKKAAPKAAKKASAKKAAPKAKKVAKAPKAKAASKAPKKAAAKPSAKKASKASKPNGVSKSTEGLPGLSLGAEAN